MLPRRRREREREMMMTWSNLRRKSGDWIDHRTSRIEYSRSGGGQDHKEEGPRRIKFRPASMRLLKTAKMMIMCRVSFPI